MPKFRHYKMTTMLQIDTLSGFEESIKFLILFLLALDFDPDYFNNMQKK